ncbi:MAG: Spy/CpxP family protein refolding chaperone [Tepidimonas sp.]|uniref:Spy/CpxP family protein refolding chaperone n=1 Tax=Tepidimonas sp. TaxID=2002775 RepID=UPI00298EF1A5|nr:Spy/CpxP family protein refolding chaperone [Tepidimonas sp.]MCS6811684.1 Spy/CpxP family protein refolding chaperone [Tepidimonas sp.]MDW8337455.1 Spy/CpxP family protein refolding chaperone [Tepidimonas sp.]
MLPRHMRSIPTLLVTTALLAWASVAQARTSVLDDSTPIVELMPLVIKHEAHLNFSDAQRQALEQFRKENMPRRVALIQRIRTLRGELRLAILDHAPQARRDELRQALLQAEQEHLQLRERCVEFVRATLTAEQFAQLRQWYLNGLQ